MTAALVLQAQVTAARQRESVILAHLSGKVGENFSQVSLHTSTLSGQSDYANVFVLSVSFFFLLKVFGLVKP